jgi:ATP-binding cassette subfamily B multidrug efflux pump
MLRAAERAEAHDFIVGLTDPKGRKGYDAHVGERGVSSCRAASASAWPSRA